MKIKFPIELPKKITKWNNEYELKTIELLKAPEWYFCEEPLYVEICYENEEWGYRTYFSRQTAEYLFKQCLNMTYEEFRKYEKQIIQKFKRRKNEILRNAALRRIG